MTDAELLAECRRLFPWLLDWALSWKEQAQPYYVSSDTLIGLSECRQLVAVLKEKANGAS